MQQKSVKNIHHELIERCKRNDQMAQMKMYDLYHRAVYGTIIRMVKDQMEAEDLMQETFLSAFRSLDHYRSEAGFGTWIKKIALNKSLNSLRKQTPNFLDIDDKLHVADTHEVLDKQTSRFTLHQIKEAINRLPEGYRVVITMYLLEGMDHDEIAEILQINPATSRSQYLRAKKKLAEQLKNKPYARPA